MFAPVFLSGRSDALLSLALEVAARRVQRASEPVAEALGVSYEAYLVLAWLWEADGSAEVEIARSLHPGATTARVDELVRCGYAERAQEDRSRVWLTDKGHRAHAAGVGGLDLQAMGRLKSADTRYLLDVLARSAA